MAQSYRDLEIYQVSFELAIEVHKMTLALPKSEMVEQGSQARRSSKSVISNIVKGFERRRRKRDFIQFLTYALASCHETVQYMEMLCQTKSFREQEACQKLLKEYDDLGGKLMSFIQSVEADHFTRRPCDEHGPPDVNCKLV